jgi:hypothetical protein
LYPSVQQKKAPLVIWEGQQAEMQLNTFCHFFSHRDVCQTILVQVILEVWALFCRFSKSVHSIRRTRIIILARRCANFGRNCG